jgi:hypothetical protein
MGRNRKTNERGSTQYLSGVEATVNGIITGLNTGIVSLPKSVYLYRHAIYDCLEGDFQSIENAMAQLKNRDTKIMGMSGHAAALDKWKMGMSRSFQGAFYVLAIYYQLAKDFYNAGKRLSNTLSERIDKSTRRGSNQVVCGQRIQL